MSSSQVLLPSSPSVQRLNRAFGFGLAAFLLVVIALTLLTFFLPEIFIGAALLRVESASEHTASVSPAETVVLAQTKAELIRSEAVLGEVANELDLIHKWAALYGRNGQLQLSEVIELLKRRIQVQVMTNSGLIGIRAQARTGAEAALLANQVGETFRSHCLKPSSGVRASFVEVAIPSVRPAIPNKPLNILFALILGIPVGLCTGVLTYLFSRRSQRPKTHRRKHRPVPA